MSTPYEKFTADSDRQELLDTPPAPPAYNEVQPPARNDSMFNLPPHQAYHPPSFFNHPTPPMPYIVQVGPQSAPAAPPQHSVVVVNNNPGGDTVIVERPCCGVCCRRFCCVVFVFVIIAIIGGVVGTESY